MLGGKFDGSSGFLVLAVQHIARWLVVTEIRETFYYIPQTDLVENKVLIENMDDLREMVFKLWTPVFNYAPAKYLNTTWFFFNLQIFSSFFLKQHK